MARMKQAGRGRAWRCTAVLAALSKTQDFPRTAPRHTLEVVLSSEEIRWETRKIVPRRKTLMYSSMMPRHVWVGEASLHCYCAVASQALSTTSTTHTRHKTRPRLRSLTAAGGFASFYMLGLGEVSVAAVGWVYVGSGQRADSSTIQILLSRGNSIVLPAAAATITKHCNFNVFVPRALGG